MNRENLMTLLENVRDGDVEPAAALERFRARGMGAGATVVAGIGVVATVFWKDIVGRM